MFLTKLYKNSSFPLLAQLPKKEKKNSTGHRFDVHNTTGRSFVRDIRLKCLQAGSKIT